MGRQVDPWNDWYHLITHTYGTWLRGDPRGWRTRHHREHVDGDYKHPPAPGTWERLYGLSKRLMKRRAVRLDVALREFVLAAAVDKLCELEIPVVAGSMTRDHLHVLVQCPDHNPREWLGRAKKHASHLVRREGLLPKGGIWQVRCKVEPIADRRHQLKVVEYIVAHENQGGATWVCTETHVRPPKRP
jgi:REP element-mobilizing transposase RayT